jgi:lipid A 3-O-deacylase
LTHFLSINRIDRAHGLSARRQRGPSTIHRLFKSLLLGAAFGITTCVADSASHPPWASPALSVETGVLWQIGTGTPFDYQLVPTQLSWRSAEFMGRELADGSRFVVRHRLTLLGTWVRRGPESRYVGITGSPSIEWWNRAGTSALFTGAGGGFGWIDSRDIQGGQGQDFTLNWFIRGGIEHHTARNVRLSAGILYQHLSNGGQTDPNPGIDALGFTLGWSWSF